VRRRAGGTADWRDGLDHIGIQHTPLEGVLSAHRKSHDQLDAIYAQMLGDETMLARNVIVQANAGKGRAFERRGRIAGRR
jgi:hypothetical protein